MPTIGKITSFYVIVGGCTPTDHSLQCGLLRQPKCNMGALWKGVTPPLAAAAIGTKLTPSRGFCFRNK